MNTHIFVSYGHDEFTEKVRVIIKTLNKRKEYQTWWDGDMKKSADWVRQIEDNLDKLIASKPDSCFIYIVTPYSTSDKRYNFCINEILRALEGRVRILPIRLTPAPMPLPIGSIQWFDLTQCEINIDNKDFQQRIEALCNLIDSKESIKIDGKQNILHRLLSPCQFTLDIDKHLQNYCPRKWLLNTTIDWLENRNERMLLIEGSPGTGKTAYSLWIATRKLPERIHAWHLCQYNDAATRSLLTCVKSLTWYLASRLPYFYDSLEISKIEDLVQGGEENSGAMLKDIILGNLKDTHVSGEKIVILIDALDEASENGVNKVAETLAQYVNDMPEWLRFIITTRNDISVTLPLKDVSYVIDLDGENNEMNCASDIKDFVKANLNNTILAKNEGLINTIVERSGNVILYAKLMCAAICRGKRNDMSQLPQGLNNFYDAHMRRYFGTGPYDFDTHALPIIHLMLASYQPIKRKYIYKRIHDTEEWCKDKTRFKRVVNRFGPLLKENEEYIIPFHKSFSDWLTDSDNRRFYVSLEDGFEKMCDWGMEVLDDDLSDDDMIHHFYTYQPQYLIAADRQMDLVKVFSDVVFWKRRKDVLGVDLMLQRMFVEFSLMNDTVKRKILHSIGFNDILYSFGNDLFNKGLFAQLKKHGFTIPLHNGMNDKERMTALRYYYINGEYETISNNMELLGKDYGNSELEYSVQNMLGLATKKCGLISRSAEFFKNAIQLSMKRNVSLEKIIYYHLNLSRVLIILCQFDDGRQKLKSALDEFYKKDWQSGITESDFEFKSRQLELAVRYVNLETELFSSVYDPVVCERELAWADRLYSSRLRMDRYYPRHLHSKILFLLREHKSCEIEPIFEELNNCQTSKFDDIYTHYYLSIYQYTIGNREESLRTAMAQLEELQQMDSLLIEKTEFLALIDTIGGQKHASDVNEELQPWYSHTLSIIKEIIM